MLQQKLWPEALVRAFAAGSLMLLLSLSMKAQSTQIVAYAEPPVAGTGAVAGAEHERAQGKVDGVIVDPQGLPMAGVSVVLVAGNAQAAHAETDAEGKFALAAEVGSYRLVVSTPGMATLEEALELRADAPLHVKRSLLVASASSSVFVSGSGYKVEEQDAATRIPMRLLDLPQTVTVLTQEILRDRAVESMQEALAYVPGVSQVLGEGRRDQVSIRGMNSNSDQYLDGVKDDATYYRDLSNTDHIEVVEGPAAVLYGRGTSGGLVDRITKKPRNEGTLLEGGSTVGSYGQKRVEGDADTLLGSPKLGLRTTGAWEDGGSFRHNYSLDRYAFAPTVRWRPNANQDLTLQVEHLRDERLPDRGIPGANGRPVPVNIATYYGWAQTGSAVPADFLHNTVTDESLDWKAKWNSWNTHEVLRHAAYSTNFQNTYSSGVSNGLVTRGEYNGPSHQENYFNQAEAWRRLHVLGVDHVILAGIEYGHQNIRRRQYTGTAASVALIDPVLTAPVLSQTLNTNNGFVGQTVAAYVQDELAFASKWKALVGVRFDNYRQSQHDYKTPTNSAARADNAPSPRVGLLYQPSANTTYYASWSHTFDPSGETMSLTAAATNNTATLNPENTNNYEIGTKRELLGERLTATAALYRLERTDVKIPDYTADPSGATYINAGTQRTDGFELAMSGHLTRHWRANGGWSWMDAYYANNPTLSNGVSLQGHRAQLIPVNSGSLWQMYEWSRGFGVGVGAIAMNSRYAATDNLIKLPGYARIDASAYYRTRHWDLDGHIENLANVHYYESAQSDAQIMPGSPIQARMTLRVKF